MRNVRPWHLALAASVVIFLVAVVLALHGARQANPAGLAGAPPLPPSRLPYGGSYKLPGEVEVVGPRITQRDEQGRVLWEAEAQGAYDVDGDRKRVVAERVRWRLFREGQGALRVEAGKMTSELQAGTVAFGDGLRIYTEDGTAVFGASQALFDTRQRTLTAEGPVTLRKGGYVASARRLRIDAVAMKAHMGGGVRLAFQPGAAEAAPPPGGGGGRKG